jgi:hypothetical protein
MINWRDAYNALSRAGYSDSQIADLAQLSRYVVNRVRNGKYIHNHLGPGYEGGMAVLGAIDAAVGQGLLPADPMNKTAEGEPEQ